jgi:hypothetical protein
MGEMGLLFTNVLFSAQHPGLEGRRYPRDGIKAQFLDVEGSFVANVGEIW